MMKVAGKFDSLEGFFRNHFKDTEGVDTQTGDYKTGDITFTTNGYWDLEKKGFNGCGVWVGYVHPSTAESVAAYNKNLKKFVQDSVVPTFQGYVKGFGGDPEKVVVEDKIKTTDMFRIYYITSEAVEEDE